MCSLTLNKSAMFSLAKKTAQKKPSMQTFTENQKLFLFLNDEYQHTRRCILYRSRTQMRCGRMGRQNKYKKKIVLNGLRRSREKLSCANTTSCNARFPTSMCVSDSLSAIEYATLSRRPPQAALCGLFAYTQLRFGTNIYNYIQEDHRRDALARCSAQKVYQHHDFQK